MNPKPGKMLPIRASPWPPNDVIHGGLRGLVMAIRSEYQGRLWIKPESLRPDAISRWRNGAFLPPSAKLINDRFPQPIPGDPFKNSKSLCFAWVEKHLLTGTNQADSITMPEGDADARIKLGKARIAEADAKRKEAEAAKWVQKSEILASNQRIVGTLWPLYVQHVERDAPAGLAAILSQTPGVTQEQREAVCKQFQEHANSLVDSFAKQCGQWGKRPVKE